MTIDTITQSQLNERVRALICQSLDERLPLIVEPPNEKVSRYLSYTYLESLYFRCLHCAKPLPDAFTFCPDCAEKMRGWPSLAAMLEAGDNNAD
jgi:hypothetical protein